MAIPSQDLIECKVCGSRSKPHKTYHALCDPCARKRNVEYQRAYRSKLIAKPRQATCKRCGECFSTASSGRAWICPPCSTKYYDEYRQTTREKQAGYSRAYRERQGNAYLDTQAQRRKDKVAAMSADELAAFREAENEKTKRLSRALKAEVFSAYGGNLCACCGETEPHFLSIDHINNDGAKMKKNGTHGYSSSQFYRYLKKEGFPSGFQILCMNCNVGKHRNGGVCPHKSSTV